jgi:hypothetical protein
MDWLILLIVKDDFGNGTKFFGKAYLVEDNIDLAAVMLDWSSALGISRSELNAEPQGWGELSDRKSKKTNHNLSHHVKKP